MPSVTRSCSTGWRSGLGRSSGAGSSAWRSNRGASFGASWLPASVVPVDPIAVATAGSTTAPWTTTERMAPTISGRRSRSGDTTPWYRPPEAGSRANPGSGTRLYRTCGRPTSEIWMPLPWSRLKMSCMMGARSTSVWPSATAR